MSDKPMEHAYLKAIYRASLGGCVFEFTFDRRSIRGAGRIAPSPAHAWAIVNAYNPMSQALDEATNQRRHAALLALIEELSLPSEPSEGREPDGTWREPGRVIHAVTREQALAIGRAFQQRAIVWCERGKVGILDCRTEFWCIRSCYGLPRDSCVSGVFEEP